MEAGKNLTLLDGKIPIVKDWTNRKVSKDGIKEHASNEGNLGWVLDAGDLVIDVDPKNGGDESFKKLVQDLRTNDPFLELLPTVLTPSGGFHIYLKYDADKYEGATFKKTLNRVYPGIDFLTKGSQCAIAGSQTNKGIYEWYDDLLGGFEQESAPIELLELLISDSKVNVKSDSQSDLGDFDGLIGAGNSNWSEDKVFEMLNRLDPSMHNDGWVKVGMALHDWDSVLGLQLWENWSRDGHNYDEGETEKRWKSFDHGGGVTLGTISHMVKEVDYNETNAKVSGYIESIKFADEKKLEFDIAPKIKKEDFNRINKEKLAKAVQDRYKDLSGVKMPIGNIRQMLMSDEIVNGYLVDKEERPGWCKDWIYVNSHNGFIDVKTLSLHKSESFNIENGKYVPMSEGGTKPSASKYVSDRGFVEKVNSIAYLPTYEGLTCTIDGSTVLNSFNPKTVPIEAKEYSDEGIEAIERVKKHIKFICSTDEDADIFTQWLAHQVQYPGRQILWSPVIQSIQGVGKSFFGELLRLCLGDRNVGTVSPTQVTSDFNGWATNVVVNVLEELRVKGHNRYDAINALKPLITDRMIQINEKGVKPFMTYNTTNYMCFTNYKDSLPLGEDDRRWWVIFVPIQSLSELEDYVGETIETYFPKLFDSIRNNGAEIRKWFLEYPITKKFLNTKQAPMTVHKESMIALEESSTDGLYEIKEMIKTGGKYFNEEVISSSDLFENLMFEHPELEFRANQRNLLLKKLGYSPFKIPVKIDGKARRLWSKKFMTNEEAREKLS